ncbi:unnamed protein product [Owenia fusiformis]|uniref:Methionine adenosyltransferase 2 subunit beta n=1 Tax=Owenia fusiformis TaxID=6347 RepID=A0A8J1TIC7_OWEFU|nr:unnamed protein product [Owenia fusiformis]
MARVLITGASGLLGRAIFREFTALQSWETLGLAFSRCGANLKKVDLTKEAEVVAVIQDFKPNVIIHSAAERRPDVVEKQEDKTKALNVTATQTICREAAKVGAFVMYLSTDYVFDGTSPPHKVTDEPNPLNKYGISKLEGEKTVREASADNIVLRVPILYGTIESLSESAVTILFKQVRDTSTPCKMDDLLRRFPTHCDDVAFVIRQLAEKRMQDPSLTGVFHWSGDENMTKYDMSLVMGEIFGISTNHIEADKNPPKGAPRPENAQLDPSRLEHLGIGKRTAFRNGIKAALEPFLI